MFQFACNWLSTWSIMKPKKVMKKSQALIEAVTGNEDLLAEILLRVPAKSLVKFKCVCKCWLTLISDPKFCHHHSTRCKKKASAIYCSRKFQSGLKSLSLNGDQSLPPLPSLKGLEKGKYIFIEDACNGLMLCSQSHRPWREELYCVCNLTTNKYTVLIEENGDHTNRILVACIAYDPAKSPYYRVLLARRTNIIDIYFSENKSWKYIEATKILNKSQNKVFWDESFHWIHSPNAHLKFDADNGSLTELTMTGKLSFLPEEKIRYFGKGGNNLILIQYRPKATLGFRILELKKGGTCWNVKQIVNLRPILHLNPTNKEFQFHMLSVLNGSREGDIVLVLAAAFNIFTYNLRSKKVKVISDFTLSEYQRLRDRSNGTSYRAYQFIESLAPV